MCVSSRITGLRLRRIFVLPQMKKTFDFWGRGMFFGCVVVVGVVVLICCYLFFLVLGFFILQIIEIVI
jgi:hypothetical protein